jgi:hypothetical protein
MRDLALLLEPLDLLEADARTSQSAAAPQSS